MAISLPTGLQARLDDLERTAPSEVAEQIRALDSEDLDTKLAAAERLSSMGRGAEGAARALFAAWTWAPEWQRLDRLELTRRASKIRELKGHALDTLVSIGDVAVDIMIAALEHGGSFVRAQAVDTLERIGDERALDSLFERLADTHDDVRRAAARAILSIGGSKAVDLFLAALRDDDPNMRQAGRHLRFVTDPRANAALRSALADEDAEVRLLVVEALGRTSQAHPDTAADLVAMLSDADARVRRLVMETLGKWGDVEAIDPLLDILIGPSRRDFTAATKALEAIDPDWEAGPNVDSFLPQAREALADADADVRRNAARTLGRVRDLEAVELLIGALGDDSADVGVAAARALGTIGSDEAVNPLVDALGHSDVEVRAAAASALGTLADPQALEPLIEALSAEFGRGPERAVESLAWALGRFRDPRTISILDRAIAESGLRTAETALRALKLIGTDEALQVIQDVVVRPHPRTDNTRIDGQVQRAAQRILWS
jgi:HEAT repeat protein